LLARDTLIRGEAMTDIPIDTLLTRLGLCGEIAGTARRLLEEARVTNPRKVRIAETKVDAARTVIDTGIQRLCHVCRTHVSRDGRPFVQVAPAACPKCTGSTNRRAVDSMVAACEQAGVRRLVFVGGSPSMRRDLEHLVSGRIELRLVDGTRTVDRATARRDVAWADLIIVLGSTQLAHKISTLYTRDREARRKLVTTRRRGIEAIAEEISMSRRLTVRS
jgi:hypothetical protein